MCLFLVSLFSMLRFSLVTKHKVCAIALFSQYWNRKILECRSVYHTPDMHTQLSKLWRKSKKLWKLRIFIHSASMMVNEMFSPMHPAMAWIQKRTILRFLNNDLVLPNEWQPCTACSLVWVFSGITKCLTYHISSLPLPTHFEPVNML